MAILKNERVRIKRERKKTKRERMMERRKSIETFQHGEGLYLYRNSSKAATLILPKKSTDGRKTIGPDECFEGDSYFMQMVPREIKLVKVITSPEETRSKMTEEKLILDQPDQVTQEGTVEHVVETPVVAPLNEEAPVDEKKNAEVLLTEDPMDGIEILSD